MQLLRRSFTVASTDRVSSGVGACDERVTRGYVGSTVSRGGGSDCVLPSFCT